MIRISVDTDEELNCIKEIRDSILCYFLMGKCSGYNSCDECAMDNIDNIVYLTKREVVEEQKRLW